MSTLQKLASKLADETLALMRETGDDRLFMAVGDVIGAASQTLEEAYLTEVRVRMAAVAAQRFLVRKRKELKLTQPKPATPDTGRLTE